MLRPGSPDDGGDDPIVDARPLQNIDRHRRCIVLAVSLLALPFLSGCDTARPPANPLATESLPQNLPDGSTPTRTSAREVGKATYHSITGAIREPSYVDVSEADGFLRDDDLVFVVTASAVTYVFPRIVMSPHHVVNAVIDERPVLVTYCQLSECATLYSRELDGVAVTFDWLQLLYSGALVLSDPSSESRWIQLTGECSSGGASSDAETSCTTSRRVRSGRSMGDVSPESCQGLRLERPIYTQTWWFAWSALFPETKHSRVTAS